MMKIGVELEEKKNELVILWNEMKGRKREIDWESEKM